MPVESITGIPPFKLSAPATVTMRPGTHGTFGVSDSGSQPLQITVTIQAVTLKAQYEPAIVTVTPRHFTLQPGATKQVTIHAPRHDKAGFIDVVFRAAPLARTGTVKISGAVATAVTVGRPAPYHTKPVAGGSFHVGAHPASSSLPLDAAIGGILGLVVIAVILIKRARRLARGPR